MVTWYAPGWSYGKTNTPWIAHALEIHSFLLHICRSARVMFSCNFNRMIVQDARLMAKGPAIIIEWNWATFRFRVCSLYLRHFRILAVIESLFCDVMQMPRYSRLVSTKWRVYMHIPRILWLSHKSCIIVFIQMPIWINVPDQTYRSTISKIIEFDDDNAIVLIMKYIPIVCLIYSKHILLTCKYKCRFFSLNTYIE